MKFLKNVVIIISEKIKFTLMLQEKKNPNLSGSNTQILSYNSFH